MPSVINGCGTWYYGKRNVTVHQGVCRACGHTATLTSYDTRLFVVVVFVPVIPLGAKRIIEECGVCRRHAAVPLDDWRRAVRRSEEAAAAYRAAPSDPELAREALAACVSFRKLDEFLTLSAEIERNLAADAKSLRLLAAAHEIFNQTGDSERLLRAALAVNDDEETREALAECLLNQGRPGEADPLLRHIVEKGIPDRAERLYGLAQGYQIAGEHEKALVAFDECAAVNPLLGRDENFVRLREASAKATGTSTPVRPVDVVRKAKSAAKFRRGLKVAPAVVVLALLAYVGLAWIQGLRREVYLLSGVDRSYTVKLNDATYTVTPHSVTPVRIREGDVRVEITDPPGAGPAETVFVRTPLLSRPFGDQAFVINPDRAAVLEHAEIIYSSGNPNPPAPTFTAGRTLHAFEDVDYAFREPPRSLQVDSHNARVTKHTLDVLKSSADMPPPTMLLILSQRVGRESVAEVARRHLVFEPDHTEYLNVLAATGKPADVAAFLRPMLTRRPLQVEVHRSYQDAMMALRQDDQVVREYEALLAAEPNDKQLMYLAGRAAQDTDKSLELCRRAAEGDGASGYAAFSLCSYYLANGQFPDAVRYGQSAVRLVPAEPGIRAYAKWAMIADGQLGKAMEMITADQPGPLTVAVPAYVDEVLVRCMQGNRSAANAAVESLRMRLMRRGPEVVNAEIRRVQADLEYANGNMMEFARLLDPSPDADDRFAVHATRGELDAADADLAADQGEAGDSPAYRHLVAYVLATRQNRADVADRHLHAATEMLDKGAHDDRALAAALRGKPLLPTAELLRLRGHPFEKRIWLAALGLRDAAARDACFALGRKLNFDLRFPHHLLEEVFESPR